MKKALFILLLLLSLAMTLSCQTKYDSPQTILWDDPTVLGVITYEVFLVERHADKSIIANYIFLAEVANPLQLIDLQIRGLQGSFVAAIRTKQVYEEETFLSGFAYSDVETDVDLTGGTFYIRFVHTGKPEKIRTQ